MDEIEEEHLEVIAAEAWPRFDAWLAMRVPALSRSRIAKLMDEGRVSHNGKPAKASSKVALGDKAEVSVPGALPAEPEPEAIPVPIIYEDEHLVVVDKPAGLVVHPGVGHPSGTLVNALLHHCGGSLSGIGGVARPGIVHRLDKETSGLMVVAKSDAVHQKLAEQFAGRTVEKMYCAITGAVPKQRSGEIRAAIGRHPTNRQKMAAVESGRPAWTEYRVVQVSGRRALVECLLHTGRTHQIRVHLDLIGCPLLGDRVYGRFGAEAPRQMLHSSRLGFTHPSSGQKIVFDSPLPPDMKSLLDTFSS